MYHPGRNKAPGVCFCEGHNLSEEGTHLAADRAALPPCLCLSVGSGSPFCTRSSFFSPPLKLFRCLLLATQNSSAERGAALSGQTLLIPLQEASHCYYALQSQIICEIPLPAPQSACLHACRRHWGQFTSSKSLISHPWHFPLFLSLPRPHPFSPHLCYPTLFEALTIKEESVSPGLVYPKCVKHIKI